FVAALVEPQINLLRQLIGRFLGGALERKGDRQQYLAARPQGGSKIAVGIVFGEAPKSLPQPGILRRRERTSRGFGRAAQIVGDWQLRFGEQQIERDD